MSAYAITRLLDHRASFRPATYVLGEVELRPDKQDTPFERAALEESLKSTGETVDLKIAMRITTVCEGANPQAADRLAEERFVAALDILDFCAASGLSEWGILDAGCIRDIATGNVGPRPRVLPFGPFTSFVIQPERFPVRDSAQALFGAPPSDLKTRLQRSIHWSREARWESSRQLQVLFRWFAMESIWKDGDQDIVPFLMWALGYPNGMGAQQVDRARIAELQAHPLYKPWKDQIDGRLTRMKLFRHDTAHAGFRAQDIAAAELEQFEALSSMVCPRVQRCAFDAVVFHGKTTRAELLAYLPQHFNSAQNLVADVTGTVLYLLANPVSATP